MAAAAQDRVKEHTMTTSTLPVIDISDLSSSATLDAIDAACRDWGFFQIERHGIDDGRIRALKRQMRAFFAQPLDEKRKILRTADNPWGFYDRELTKHTPDWKQIYDYGPPDGGVIMPQWPVALPEFRGAIQAFYDACYTLALRLLRAIAVNLGMPPRSLDGYFAPQHTSFLRLNYYPECSKPARPTGLSLARDGHLGVNQHTDAGALTLLLQDEQPGLEVFHDGDWHLVEPRPDALVVNIGDIVQVWSNDRYQAALHRGLVSADTARFSAPFFLNPAYEVEYAPLPSTVSAYRPPRYWPINWGAFRARRAAGDYANQGRYAQISDYHRTE
jgi:isopenicillin N synthase-like dioxygenase